MKREPIQGIVNINGKIFPLHLGKIPVLDHGFLYGDSVYETLRTHWGFPFLLKAHISRLFESAARLDLKSPYPRKHLIAEVLRSTTAYWKRYGKKELYIRVIISRGYGDIGFDPDLCPNPSLIIIIKAYQPLPKPLYGCGVALALVPVIRNDPRAMDPNIKSGNYLNNILAYLEARKKKAFDALMQNSEGYLTEGTTSNVFLVKNKTLLTPSVESGLLKGLTRSLIIETARKNHVQVREMKITKQALFSADECFISSTLKGILPVKSCDSKKIGNGRPGAVTRKMMDLLTDAVRNAIREEYCVDF